MHQENEGAGRGETDGEKIAGGAFLSSRGVVVFSKNFARVSCLAFIFLMHPSQTSVCPSSVRPSYILTGTRELCMRFCRRPTGACTFMFEKFVATQVANEFGQRYPRRAYAFSRRATGKESEVPLKESDAKTCALSQKIVPVGSGMPGEGKMDHPGFSCRKGSRARLGLPTAPCAIGRSGIVHPVPSIGSRKFGSHAEGPRIRPSRRMFGQGRSPIPDVLPNGHACS